MKLTTEDLSRIISEELEAVLDEKKGSKRQRKKKAKKKKAGDRCTRIAKRKYDVWPSAYASGAVVKCRQGKIWKGLKEEDAHPEVDEMINEEELTDVFGASLDKAVRRRRSILAVHADNRTPKLPELRRTWIAYPEYWAAQGTGESCGTNCTGTSSMSGILVNADNAVWNFDITGDDNKFASNQSGNAGHSLKVVLDGSDGDFQFTQSMTTTCSSGACHGIIDVDLDSENASVSIKQGD